jgi:hypothetical protein
MFRNYEYKGYHVTIAVETQVRTQRRLACQPCFTAVVQVATGCAAILAGPLRLVGRAGVLSRTEADAVMGGYTA